MEAYAPLLAVSLLVVAVVVSALVAVATVAALAIRSNELLTRAVREQLMAKSYEDYKARSQPPPPPQPSAPTEADPLYDDAAKLGYNLHDPEDLHRWNAARATLDQQFADGFGNPLARPLVPGGEA